MTKGRLRRQFVRDGLALALGAVVSQPAWSSASGSPDRAAEIARLAFVNTHTGESLDVVYREGPRYLGDALAEIDRVLRDHRSGDVHEIDRALLEQLVQVRSLLGVGKRPFHVISGYRSPRTNAMLASLGNGVATKSLHLQGRAIDIRMPGVELGTLHRAALSMQAGGVGYYARSDFVHLDTGRVRRW
ncbi:MAG: DUF882 domain-containing protein [Burkholderiaceae bacterium]|nr:DUF882 domain-containing protein [Burkholderiaceae bacterium]